MFLNLSARFDALLFNLKQTQGLPSVFTQEFVSVHLTRLGPFSINTIAIVNNAWHRSHFIYPVIARSA